MLCKNSITQLSASSLMQLLQNNLKYIPMLQSLKDKKIALWGAGRVAHMVAKNLQKQNYTISCIVDSSAQKWGQNIYNIPVVNQDDELFKQADHCMLTMRSVSAQDFNYIQSLKPSITYNAFYILQNFQRFLDLFNKLEDETSKTTLSSIITAELNLDMSLYAQICVPQQYFCLPEFMQTRNSHFVDVGAFVGDSIETFLQYTLLTDVKRIFAFEPSPEIFTALEHRKERLCKEWALQNDQISLYKMGLGDISEKMALTSSIDNKHTPFFQSTQSNTLHENLIPIEPLDVILQDVPIDFIKADIEGYELKMLRGAKQSIAKYKPKMAICIYHNIEDFLEIYEYLTSLVPEYRFAMRHHSHASSETVLYIYS